MTLPARAPGALLAPDVTGGGALGLLGLWQVDGRCNDVRDEGKVAPASSPVPPRSPALTVAVGRRLSYDATAPGPSCVASRPRARHRAAEESVPDLKPFRALRFDPDVVGDLGAVVAPPYDVIGPDLRETLLARHPRNAVRLDLPAGEAGDEDADEKYRRVARTFAAWRTDGTLRKDPRPGVYVYEQTYRVPNTDVERSQRGFFARLRIEPFGPGSGVLPHERTMSGPKEDRYRLLRATGVNTSPVIGLYEDPDGRSGPLLAAATAAPALADLVDDDGVRHRLWLLTGEGDESPASALA